MGVGDSIERQVIDEFEMLAAYTDKCKLVNIFEKYLRRRPICKVSNTQWPWTSIYSEDLRKFAERKRLRMIWAKDNAQYPVPSMFRRKPGKDCGRPRPCSAGSPLRYSEESPASLGDERNQSRSLFFRQIDTIPPPGVRKHRSKLILSPSLRLTGRG
jgi:hypothetical protein